MLLFSGSSNILLTDKVAGELNTRVAQSETVRFADSEVRVRVLEEARKEHCVVVQSLAKSPDLFLMEMCQFAEVLKREKAAKITAVIPYLSYSRQHRVNRKGESISVKLVASFIKTAGFDDCILLDVHDEEVLNYFKIPVQHLSAVELFAEYIDQKREEFGGADLVVVSADEGRIGFAQNLASILEVGFAFVQKERSLEQTDLIMSNKLQSEVKNKEVIIVDDIVSTGATVLQAAKECLEKSAFHVSLVATHGVFSTGENVLLNESVFNKIAVTDSIDQGSKNIFEKLDIVTIAPLIARSLLNFV